MKLTIIIIFVSLMQVSAASFGQNVTLKKGRVTLEGAFREIKKQTGYNFFLSLEGVKVSTLVSADLDNVPLEKALEQLLWGLPLEYTISQKTVIIKAREKSLLDRIIEKFSAIDVSGRVVDSEGNPLPGASVAVKGTRISAVTDGNGAFVLKSVEEGAVLIISYVGFEPVEVKAAASVGTVRLSSSLSKLDEVQVIAYGTTSRRLSTGLVSTVKAEDIEKQPVQNPLLALQGRVPGLIVNQNSGMPGGGLRIRIQGQNSIRSGNDPLFIIDGVPIISQLPSTGLDAVIGNVGEVRAGAPVSNPTGNPLNYLNPADIESIDVLRDADATAIYGSRAANGAILITTKKGRVGRMKADFDFKRGMGDVERRVEMLNTRQYLDMRYEAYKNDNIDWKATGIVADDLKTWDTTRYTNWQQELIGRTARYIQASATISGGSELFQYLVGGTYKNETTVFPGDFSNKIGSAHFSLNGLSPNKRLRVQFSGNYFSDNNQLPIVDPTRAALLTEPDAPEPFTSDGKLNWAPNAALSSTFRQNPYIDLVKKYRNLTDNLIGNFALGYKIIENLELSSSFGYTNMQTSDFSTSPTSAIAPELRESNPNSASYGSRTVSSYIVEPQLAYKRNVLKGKLEALLGVTVQETNIKSGSFYGTTYASDALLENFQSAGVLGATTSLITQYRYNALFGRVNYNLGDKYIVNVTARRDGSSRFGENNRFHNFGAVGAAWVFSNAGLVKEKLPWLSFGKLRASYGTTGNDQITDYLYVSKYASVSAAVPYQGVSSLSPSGLPNPYLQWEETRKMSLGLDLGVLDNRILFNLNHSVNTSDNQLNSYLLPSITGFSSIFKNFPAKVKNVTWEFSMTSENIRHSSLQWTTSANLTVPKNRLVAFPGLETSSYASLLAIGYSLNIKKVPALMGVNPLTGSYQFFDSKGNLTSDPSSVTDYVIVNAEPKWYGGLQNSVSYGAFSLDVFLQFVKQKGLGIFFGNGITTPGAYSRGYTNQPVTVLDRWRAANDNVEIQKFTSRNGNAQVASAFGSDAAYGDASYIRLKNISLAYRLPQKWTTSVGLQHAKLYANAQNLLTITNYQGLDPESQGVVSLPPLRVVMFGLQVGF